MDGWWECEALARAWPQFADRYAERFRRMWRFYLLSCAGAFRAGSLQVFLFSFRIASATDKANPAKFAIRRLTFPAMPSNHPLVP